MNLLNHSLNLNWQSNLESMFTTGIDAVVKDVTVSLKFWASFDFKQAFLAYFW